MAVVSRPNSAYDFGSWRDALGAYPQIATKDRVVLTNDSIEGPAGPLDELLGRIEETEANVWGVTLNPLPRRHLHSFLLAFAGGVLAREPLRNFFAEVKAQPSKKSVIEFYELGLTAAADEAWLSVEAGWTADELGVPEATLIPIYAWQELMDAGFPFVKRVLLTQLRFAAWRPAIEARLKASTAEGG